MCSQIKTMNYVNEHHSDCIGGAVTVPVARFFQFISYELLIRFLKKVTNFAFILYRYAETWFRFVFPSTCHFLNSRDFPVLTQVSTEWQETLCKKCRCLDDYSVECTEKSCHDCPEVFVRTDKCYKSLLVSISQIWDKEIIYTNYVIELLCVCCFSD